MLRRRLSFERLESRQMLSGTDTFTNSAPVTPLSSTPPPASMSTLNASDFTYLGAQSLGQFNYFSGLAYRPETKTFFSILYAGQPAFDLVEFSNTGPGGGYNLVKDWGEIDPNNLLKTSGDTSPQMEGLWWDDATQRLWMSFGDYYNAAHANQQVLAYVTLSTGKPVIHGPWGVVASVGSDQVKSEITPAPSQLAAITGNKWMMFGGSSNTAQDMSWGTGLVSVADPSSLKPGSLTSAEEIINWPMQYDTYTTDNGAGDVNDYFTDFPSGASATVIAGNENVNPPSQLSYEYNALINDGGNLVAGDRLSNYAFVNVGNVEGFIYVGSVANGYAWYGNNNAHDDTSATGVQYQNDMTSLVNPGQPLVDNQNPNRGYHADQWQLNAYFVNYQDVLNAATAVKNGTATAATLQVAPSSITNLATLGGSPPVADLSITGSGAILGSYFDPTTDNLYLLSPGSFQLLVWHVAAPSTAPTAPTGLVATGGSGQISLSWSATTGASTYDVYRGTTGGGEAATPIATGVTGTSYVDKGLSAGTTYYYEITAVNSAGQSAKSTEVSAMTISAAPTGLIASGRGGQISLSWTATTGASTYDVYRGTIGGGEAATPIATGVTGTSYVDKSVSAGTTYYYEITAVNSAGESAKSTEVSATTISAAPTGLVATGGSGQISLSWTAATGASTYDVYRGTTSGGEATTPIATGVTGTSYVDKGLSAGSAYYYEITAVNSAGESAKSSEASAITIPPGATASFVATDTTTQGSWKGTYGADGYNVIDDASSYPSYAQVSASGNQNDVWASSTGASQALQKETNPSDRIAATWYSPASFTIDVNLTDGNTHQVALYLLDWDKLGRSERIDVLNAANGAVLDSETASNFSGGEYLRWTLGGHVELRVTSLYGPNAVVSGLFFGQPPASAPASASFVQGDVLTAGNWQNAYGADGYNVVDNAASYPSYAQVAVSGQQSFVWAASTTDQRALQKAANPTDRIAATWYSPTSFTLDVSLTDGNTHQISLYLLDWDQLGRSERIDVIDPSTGTILSSHTASGFGSGEYLTWKIAGHVQLRVTSLSGPNAVASGLFFGTVPDPAPAAASFDQSDRVTSGNWKNIYGADGYNVIGNAANLPGYAQIAVGGQQSYVWAGSTGDGRALQKATDSTDRIAASWYSPSSFTIAINLTDGKTHEVSLYLLDWDQLGRSERVDVIDPSTGTVLNSQTASQFGNGEYLTWTLGGEVQLRITDLSGANAVLSGMFFGNITPPASNPATASFVTGDSNTAGTWQGKYGSAGYDVFDNAVSLPSYAQLSASGEQNWVWASSTTDPRALQKAGSPSDRIAATWYAANSFTIDLNLTDGKVHQVAAYLLDWDLGGRTEQVSVLDAATGATLDTRTVSNFTGGEYLVWNLSGHVRLVFTHVGGLNAVLSGLFVD